MSMISLEEFNETTKTEIELKPNQTLVDVLKPGDELIAEYRGYFVKGSLNAIGTNGKVKIDDEWDDQLPIGIYRVVKSGSKKVDGSGAKTDNS
jgi:hypothetical protein